MNTIIECYTNLKIKFKNFRVVKIKCIILEKLYEYGDVIDKNRYQYDGYILILKDGFEVSFPELDPQEIYIHENISFFKNFHDVEFSANLSPVIATLSCSTFKQLMSYRQITFSRDCFIEDWSADASATLYSVKTVDIFQIDPNNTMGDITHLSNELIKFLENKDEKNLVPFLKMIDDNCVALRKYYLNGRLLPPPSVMHYTPTNSYIGNSDSDDDDDELEDVDGELEDVDGEFEYADDDDGEFEYDDSPLVFFQ